MSRFNKSLGLVLVAGCLIAMLSFGARSSMGLFKTLVTDTDTGFGLAPLVFPMAIAIQNLLWGVMQPVAGAFADRFGSWRVLFVGGIIYAASLFLMTIDGGPWLLHLSAGFLMGTAIAGTSFGLVMAAFARLVAPEHRSWAMGIATAAGSMGQFLVVPAAQTMIAEFGWVVALQILALIVLSILPLSLVLRGGSGEADARQAANAASDQSFMQALGEALTHRGFVLLTIGFFACGFLLSFVTVYLPQHVVESGLSASTASFSIAMIGLFNVVGAYAAGLIGARFSKKLALSAIYFGRILGVLWLLYAPPTGLNILIFGAFMGLLWLSTVPLTNGIIGQVFGMKYMATLYGLVFLSHQLGSFVSLMMASWIEQAGGSIETMWWVCIWVNAAAVVVHLPIDQRPLARLSAKPA